MARVLHAGTTRHAELWQGPGRYIRIVVHDSTVELRDAAHRYRPETGAWGDGTGACFHPARGMSTDIQPRHFAGVMRLAIDYLDVEVVIHECVHAALAIYRLDVVGDVRLGDGYHGTLAREETLAYIVGDLTTEVFGVLNGAGVYPPT